MINKYTLGDDKNFINIDTNQKAIKAKKNQIVLFPKFKIQYKNKKLLYTDNSLIAGYYYHTTIMLGRPYAHTFSILNGKMTVKITSKDQKTFEIIIY